MDIYDANATSMLNAKLHIPYGPKSPLTSTHKSYFNTRIITSMNITNPQFCGQRITKLHIKWLDSQSSSSPITTTIDQGGGKRSNKKESNLPYMKCPLF